MLEIVGAVERHDILGLDAFGREPERRFQPPRISHHRALRAHHVVQSRRLLRPGSRQLFVREPDRKPPRIVLAHFLVRVRPCCPLAEARHIHAPDVETRIAIHHPLRQRQSHAAALRKARHDGTGHPEIPHSLYRTHQRIAIGRERERTIDHALDTGLGHGREMLIGDLQRRRDSL